MAWRCRSASSCSRCHRRSTLPRLVLPALALLAVTRRFRRCGCAASPAVGGALARRGLDQPVPRALLFALLSLGVASRSIELAAAFSATFAGLVVHRAPAGSVAPRPSARRDRARCSCWRCSSRWPLARYQARVQRSASPARLPGRVFVAGSERAARRAGVPRLVGSVPTPVLLEPAQPLRGRHGPALPVHPRRGALLEGAVARERRKPAGDLRQARPAPRASRKRRRSCCGATSARPSSWSIAI